MKQCPFCGNQRVKLQKVEGKDGWRDKYYVLCDYRDGGCGASGGIRHMAIEAEQVWNMRKRKYKEEDQ